MTNVTAEQISADPGLTDWGVEEDKMRTCFLTGSFVTGAELVASITTVAEQLGHHPDVLLRYPDVIITSTSHDVGALTERDTALAKRISAIAADMGVKADPGRAGPVQL